MAKQYDFAVYIGRFQPIHNGHLACIRQALSSARRVIVVVGSIGRARDIRHAWTFSERESMIRASLSEADLERIQIVGVRDFIYSEERWLEHVQETVDKVIYTDQWEKDFSLESPSVCMVGHKRDHTSDYIDAFPQWDKIAVDELFDQGGSQISATGVREAYYKAIAQLAENGDQANGDKVIERLSELPVPASVTQWMASFATSVNPLDARRLSEEWLFVQKYKSQYDGLKYPVIQQTVDAVVVVSGHILLVRRGAMPGKGMWALPGGFIEENERSIDAMVRELREETRLKLPEKVIRGSVKAQERYDEPMRSTRGRTITEAFLVRLPAQSLPEVRGGSDANKAKWFTLAEFERMEDQLFEDHFHIVQDLLGRAKRS